MRDPGVNAPANFATAIVDSSTSSRAQVEMPALDMLAAFPTPSQNDKCCGGSLHAICHTSLVLGNLYSDSHFRPLEIRPTVATGSGTKRTQFKSFVHSPSPPTNARSIWIEAVAGVILFKVERWQAVRMAPRSYAFDLRTSYNHTLAIDVPIL